jgi:hypothetical protein
MEWDGGKKVNDKAIRKHLYKWVKNDRIIIARTDDGSLFAGDIAHLLRLPEDSPVFESRRVFPIIPEPGQTYMLSDFFGESPSPKTSVKELFERELAKELKPLKLTFWIHDTGDPLQCFKMESGEKVFVRRYYLNHLGDYMNYKYFTAGTGRMVVIKNHKDELEGVVMPVRTDLVESEVEG